MVSTGFQSRNRRKWLAVFIVFASLAAYLYLYQADPFPEGITDLVTSGMICAAAFAAAIVSTRVWMRYGKETPSRRIWMHYFLGLLGWAVAEAIWLYEYAVDGNYVLGPADPFWVVSYLFFVAALYGQYVLIYRPARSSSLAFLALSIVASFMFTYLYALWLSGTNDRDISLEILVSAFYAIGDMGLVIGALWLVFVFRDGALGRPWIGLVVFAFSDLLYSWLETSGLYAWSIAESNPLTVITDATYLAAYLAVAFGCYLQWLLLTYGPRMKK
jgi:hypothetical protein